MNRRTLLGVVGSVALGGCFADLVATGPPVDAGCPDFADYAESRCAHTGDPELALRPSSRHLDGGVPVALTVTLSNDRDRSVRVVDFPSLKRRVDGGEPSEARGTSSEPRSDGEWEHAWPFPAAPFGKDLDPGASYSWELLFDGAEPTGGADEAVEVFELDLDAGTYAAVVDAKLGDDIVQCVAPFEVGEGESG